MQKSGIAYKALLALFLIAAFALFCACELDDPESDEDDQSDCGDLCRKMQSCELNGFNSNFEDLRQCIDRCKDVDTDSALGCMLGCDHEQACEIFSTCLLEC